jgi:hypothetical protein
LLRRGVRTGSGGCRRASTHVRRRCGDDACARDVSRVHGRLHARLRIHGPCRRADCVPPPCHTERAGAGGKRGHRGWTDGDLSNGDTRRLAPDWADARAARPGDRVRFHPVDGLALERERG